MHDVRAEPSHVQIILHDDEYETPDQFVVELLHAVFKKSVTDATELTEAINTDGHVVCGIYPHEIAQELLAAARKHIQAAGQPLRISSLEDGGRCRCCNTPCGEDSRLSLNGVTALICDVCMHGIAGELPKLTRDKQFEYAHEALAWHFAGIRPDGLTAASRRFPGHMRADVQVAADSLFAECTVRFFGVDDPYHHEALSFAGLTRNDRLAPATAPAQYHEVDIGESAPVRCLDNGVWLCQAERVRFAVLLSSKREYGSSSGTRIEIAVPTGTEGSEFVQRCFAALEDAVRAARSYRGKVLSLEGDAGYRGLAQGVTVHRLPAVQREQVILPELTLTLLDRNVLRFVESRPELRALGQSTRKGILLYGPPGTGKTHTIRYLASNLRDHTTLIITAAEIGHLTAYMNLARLLQPAMVVIEDVDLIARNRNRMGPCEETMLNALLNEMDGLKEDADILFILTTNRPEELESALAGRPGRIDQAIEVPLPDEVGRGKLVRLYGKGLPLGDAVADEAAQRTAGVSAAFIKELMRRIAQASIARDGGKTVQSADISEALDDMLFAGGKLNVKLLGGATEMAEG